MTTTNRKPAEASGQPTHTDAAKAKMSAATKGKPRPWKHRPTKRAVAEPRLNRRGE